jgi:oxygen-independent coproporphyrinogen-3 oxidase
LHLYLHIPFCKQACHYCDFHFSTNTAGKKAVVEAIAKEIILRKSYLESPELATIYFGGGTPSLLNEEELKLLMGIIQENFDVHPDAEITLEANPDDLNREKLKQLKTAGINRLSIGLQSFHEPHLKFLNRAHTADESEVCVKNAQDAGIDNISIDLIYAIPANGHEILQSDIQKAFQLNVSHISAYCLTIESRTTFGNWLKNNKIKPIDEEFAARQFEIMIESLESGGYEQYEISNFARNEHYSRHNSSYWQQEPYLGVGPSAHSYNGLSRENNIANNAKYLSAIGTNTIPANYEQLSVADQTNEYLLTGLRTKWGCNILKLNKISGSQFSMQSGNMLKSLTEQGWVFERDETIYLTQTGKLFADRAASDLFIE